MFHAIVGSWLAVSDLDPVYSIVPPAGAQLVRIQAVNSDLTYTLDGTTPTETVGFDLADGEVVEVPTTPVPKLFSPTGGAKLTFMQ